MNKIFFIGGGVVLLILIIGVFYLSPQGTIVPPEEPIAPITSAEKEIITEQESLNQDIADLEELAADTSLDDIGEDLENITEGETVSTDGIEEEFFLELGSLSEDLSALESFDNDTSLDNIDSELSGIAE